MNMYVAGQIVVWMVLASLAGLVTGWLTRGRLPLVRALKSRRFNDEMESTEDPFFESNGPVAP